MRGADTFTMRRLEDFVPAKHPLRAIRERANAALLKLGPLLTAMYAAEVKGGRPSIAPEKLLRAMLLQVLYSVRSERQWMEQVQYNLLFRWFIDARVAMKVTPHVAQNTSGRKSAVPDEIAQTEGYAMCQRRRKLIEQGFGWAKMQGAQ